MVVDGVVVVIGCEVEEKAIERCEDIVIFSKVREKSQRIPA